MTVQINSINPIAASGAQAERLRTSFFSIANASVPQVTNAVPAASATQPTTQELQQAADTLNQHFSGIRDDLHFTVAHDLGLPVISVVNADTGEVVWQVPTEQALDAARQVARNGHMLEAKA